MMKPPQRQLLINSVAVQKKKLLEKLHAVCQGGKLGWTPFFVESTIGPCGNEQSGLQKCSTLKTWRKGEKALARENVDYLSTAHFGQRKEKTTQTQIQALK